jgi:hypothetical protein
LHRAREIPKERFKQEVEKELTGRETEPWEIIYFKLYESQTPLRAGDRDGGPDAGKRPIPRLLFGNDLCGLPGEPISLDHGDPEMLLFSIIRFFKFLPEEQRQAFLKQATHKAS